MTRTEIFEQLTKQAVDTYKCKNADYGDSFVKVRQKFPNAILIRLNDKLNRLEALWGGKQAMVTDESIDDTLLDLANYALMELAERHYEREFVAELTGRTLDGTAVHKTACEYLSDDRCMLLPDLPPCAPNEMYCMQKAVEAAKKKMKLWNMVPNLHAT